MSNVIPARFSSLRVATTVPITRARCMSGRDFDVVDDADDGGVNRTVLQARRHPGGTAADDEYGLPDAGVDRVHGYEVTAFGLALRIHRPDDQQLAADQPRVFPRGDDRPDDLCEKHPVSGLCGRLANREHVFEVR